MNAYEGLQNNPVTCHAERQNPDELAKARQRDPGFLFVAQQVYGGTAATVDQCIDETIRRLEEIAAFRPDTINSHTGKDYFSFEDNCRVIEAVEAFSQSSGIPVWHETHRGRFSFHGSTFLPYLDVFPDLSIAADFSHWCNVSESMLQHQDHIIDAVIPHIRHIHARIGWEQSAQVNDPFAPEWSSRVETFLGWWQRIVDHASQSGAEQLSITPEFGPWPYMPEVPYSREPIADQNEINREITTLLRDRLKITTLPERV